MTQAELQQRLGHTFSNGKLLRRALTHRSWTEEVGPGEHNERLEYLGDAVLELLVTDMLFRRFPQATEGQLSKARAELVRSDTLAKVGLELQLGDLLLLGRGEEKTGGRQKPKLLADAFEAVLGAIYLDGGLEPCKEAASLAYESRLKGVTDLKGIGRDPRSRLQELATARWKLMPAYDRVAIEGPAHMRRFIFAVRVGNRVRAEGVGSSKQRAKSAAAAAALAKIEAGEE